MKAALAGLFALVLAAPPADAQSYPAKPVRLIIPFPAGGPTDLAARLIATRMGEGLGQAVITDNRAGASGTLGADAVAKAAPDGYTLLLTPVSSHFIASFVTPNLPYDPIRDFTPICNATDASTGIAVTSSLPVKTLPDLIALARREPGKLSYSSAGVGSLFHLTGAMFNQAAGVEVVHVPYKGAAQALVDLASGQISVTFSVLAPMLPYIKTGKIRLIAVMDEARYPGFPDVAAASETLPGFRKLEGGLAFLGPAGLPRPVVQKVNAEIAKAVFAPDVKARLEESGFRVSASTPEELATVLKTAQQTYGNAVKLAGVKPE